MMQFGNLTVVIPTFNRAAILSRNLKDLFAQKQASRLRILIVDDASTDGTFERASFWTDRFPRLTVERNRRRLGFPDNPLYALSRVSTRYLMVMSDEDVPCIKKISELMKLSRNHKFDFLTGAPIYREFKRLNPRDLFSATRYMSGLVYDTDLVKSIIRNHAKDFATIEMFHLYPWTRLALPALLQGRAFSSPFATFQQPSARGEYLITASSGSPYTNLDERAKQAMSFDKFLSNLLESERKKKNRDTIMSVRYANQIFMADEVRHYFRTPRLVRMKAFARRVARRLHGFSPSHPGLRRRHAHPLS